MKHRNCTGYTLTEILVALAIVGILAAIAVPAYQNYATRSRVAEALTFADAARVPVELSLAVGGKPAADLLGNAGKKVDMMTALTWNPPKPGSNLAGYILAEMDLPGFGKRAVLVLERRTDGNWHCASAVGYVGAGQAMVADYLPASCREGAALAKAQAPAVASAAQTCAADQEQITTADSTGKSQQVCAKRCAAGEKRDPANLTSCVADVAAAKPPTSQSDCLPNQRFAGDQCVKVCNSGFFFDPVLVTCSLKPPASVPPPAAAGPTSAAAPAGPAAPAASTTTCKSYEILKPGDKDCSPKPIPPQTQRPTMASNPCGADGIWIPNTPASLTKSGPFTYVGLEVQAAPDFRKGPVAGYCAPKGNRQGDAYADVACHQCTGPQQICEQIHSSKPCPWPNNACGIHIKNNLDGTRTVTRGCISQEAAWRDWYLGTSDEDKCDVIKNNQHVEYSCTFACKGADCNKGGGNAAALRPTDDTLWRPRP